MLLRSRPREIWLSSLAILSAKRPRVSFSAVQMRTYSSEFAGDGDRRDYRTSCWGAALLLAGAGILTLSERREVRHQKFRNLARDHCHTVDVGDVSERFNAAAVNPVRLDDSTDGEVIHAVGLLSREGEAPSHKLLGVSPPRALRMQFSVRVCSWPWSAHLIWPSGEADSAVALVCSSTRLPL